MGQSLSKVKTIQQEIEKFLPVLRYKRISRQLQAENSQVKTHNQELQSQNEQLKVSVESFEKDNTIKPNYICRPRDGTAFDILAF